MCSCHDLGRRVLKITILCMHRTCATHVFCRSLRLGLGIIGICFIRCLASTMGPPLGSLRQWTCGPLSAPSEGCTLGYCQDIFKDPVARSYCGTTMMGPPLIGPNAPWIPLGLGQGRGLTMSNHTLLSHMEVPRACSPPPAL